MAIALPIPLFNLLPSLNFKSSFTLTVTYSFNNFLHDVDRELLGLVGKTTTDFPDYEFYCDFNSQFPVALSAQEAIIQHGSISESIPIT